MSACQNGEELTSVWESIAINGYPKWWSCGFPSKAVYFTPFNSTGQTFKLLDWSVSSPEHDYTMPLKQYRYTKGDASLPTSPANAWYAPGWVAPTFRPIFNSHLLPVQPDLYRLFAATHKVTLIRPRSKVKRVSASVLACVAAPFSILSSEEHGDFSLVQDAYGVYHVTCINCQLSNCLTVTRKSVFVILRQPPYVLLPVYVNGTWFSDPGIEAIHRASSLLRRGRRFVAALILGITALIGVISSFALSTISLVREVHTAHQVDQLSKNVSIALLIQEKIEGLKTG